MFNNTERLEKVLYRGGLFTIKNIITFSNKSSNGNKLLPIYERSYNSTKYNNLNELSVVSITDNEYVAFCYNNFEQKINQEVFISYPHYEDMITFLENVLGMVLTEDMYSVSSVNPKYQDVMVESEEFCSGSKLIAIPAVWESNIPNAGLSKGVILYLGTEEAAVMLDIKALRAIYFVLNNFNLSEGSNSLIIMGMLNELSKSSGGFTTNKPSTGGFNTATHNSPFNKNKRGLFSNSNGNKHSLGGNNFKPQQNNEETGAFSVPEDNEVEEETYNQPVEKPTGKSLSMSDILDKASEVNVEDINDVEI